MIGWAVVALVVTVVIAFISVQLTMIAASVQAYRRRMKTALGLYILAVVLWLLGVTLVLVRIIQLVQAVTT